MSLGPLLCCCCCFVIMYGAGRVFNVSKEGSRPSGHSRRDQNDLKWPKLFPAFFSQRCYFTLVSEEVCGTKICSAPWRSDVSEPNVSYGGSWRWRHSLSLSCHLLFRQLATVLAIEWSNVFFVVLYSHTRYVDRMKSKMWPEWAN
jgi:hypothetical protein